MVYERVKKLRKPSRPQRPRLEVSQASSVYAVFDDYGRLILCDVHQGRREEILIQRKDITRVRKFLEKCEAYLESQRKAKRGGR